MTVIINLLLVAVGFVLLIKGADFLVNGASSLAKRFNVSDIAIGLTVVAMGTSAPELVVNIISGSVTTESAGGAATHDIVFGNIIGSNIFNIFLILGVSSVIYPLTVQRNALWKEIPYSLLATFVFFILVNDQIFFGKDHNALSVIDAGILIVMFLIFLVYIFMNLTRNPDDSELVEDIVIFGSVKTTVMIVLGIAGLIFGGKMIVDNAVEIAKAFDVSEKLIGLTILAAGTSLPELATSAVAAFQKKSDLAVGNIVGSNIFNLLLVIGTTGFIHAPLGFPPALNLDLYFVMGGTFLLFLFMFTFAKYKLDRSEGFLYLLGFVAYMYILFEREGMGFGIFF
ncbi:calcium/sodium antiporter [Marinoscillum furvescens]|uniref:Cation:H+ antiporter n=1 Tax=Marinoscillum furvescens DSM 4134 TaxID=1122208 RepID=A0A3D9KZA5_MARFU|nr:calcium/sodium antiporter [Marinoscillum furvescens]RED95622.1 cation:H+ antiporter [Marinoscillum furvescens DSM 4134]